MTALVWMVDAVCRDVEDFTERPPADAINICMACPVRTECALYGADHIEDITSARWSVTYGGLTGRQLAELVRSRKRRAAK